MEINISKEMCQRRDSWALIYWISLLYLPVTNNYEQANGVGPAKKSPFYWKAEVLPIYFADEIFDDLTLAIGKW